MLIVFCVSLLSNCSDQIWVAPENPIPKVILREARDDVKNENYEKALLKYIWINEHSLNYSYYFIGVRSSYAIQEWYQLGQIFPDVQEKYNEFRNNAKQNVINNDNLILNFSDFQSFNRYLKEPQETIDLFLWIEANRPNLSSLVYQYVKIDLFDAGRFDILNKHINPEKEYQESEILYKSMLNHEDDSN